MKQRLVLGLAMGLCAIGAAAGPSEQEAPKPKLYCIFQEHVKPGMAEQYEAATRDLIGMLQSYQIDPEKVNFETVFGPEVGYVFVIPVENFAGMDTVHENWMEARKTVGEESWMATIAKAEAAVEHQECLFVSHRPDLSYQPEKPRLNPAEVKYIHYGFHYVIPGEGQKLEQVAKDYVALCKKLNVNTSWSVYEVVTGDDLPLYVVTHVGKSPADWYTHHEWVNEKLGEAGQELAARAQRLVRKYEEKFAVPRPDLSYPAGQPSMKKGSPKADPFKPAGTR